jgi:hypothetical protein
VFSHDLRTLPDGRFVTLEYVPNTQGPREWLGFLVRVWDPVAEVVTFELNSQELLDAGILEAPATDVADPWHANAFDWEELEDGPEVTVSVCRDQSILGYSVDRREVSWILARGQGWTIQDETGAPLGDEALPQCAHGVDADGRRLLVYDNGRDRLQSSATEWVIDVESHTVQRTFTWTEPDWYEFILGDVEELEGGRIHVTQARLTCGEITTSVEVVRETGAVAVQNTFPDGAIYRSERIDGCRLFPAARDCPDVQDRLDELAPLFEARR